MTAFVEVPRARAGGDEVLGFRLVEKLGGGPRSAAWIARDAGGRVSVVKVFSPDAEETKATYEEGLRALERAASSETQGARLLPLRAISLETLAYAVDYFENGNAAGIPALRWGVERTLEFFTRVCRAVAVLHGAGFAHRAMKPSNVLIDQALEPVLADAGMPALRDPSVPLSASDALYRAPEELDGRSAGAPPGDIYGLGRLLWFLLLGSDPEEPYEALATLVSLKGKPDGLVRIVRKATALHPAARYQSVAELEADLVRYPQAELVGIAGTDASAAKPSGVARVSPVPVRRAPARSRSARPAERVIGAVGLLAVAAATALLFAVAEPSPKAAGIFGFVATAGLALGTLLLEPYAPRPRLSQLAMFGAVVALLTPLELDRLVLVRWKLTLENGSDQARSRVARLLSRWGARDLRGAKLENGDLRRADLGRVDFRNANLSRANLRGANLAESNLSGAVVHGADLAGAYLVASNVHEAEGWLHTQCDRSTAMPDGWRCLDGRPARRQP